MNFTSPSRIVLIVLCFTLISVTACSSKDQIIGKWQEVGTGTEPYEFLDDGTILLQDGTNSGKWSRLDDGRLKMEFPMSGTNQTLVCKTEFKGDSLTLTNSDGQAFTFERVK